MSLACIHTGKLIEYGAPLFAAQIPGAPGYAAVSEDVINQIPKSLRNTAERADETGGINIYRASSSYNLTGTYSWNGFQKEKFYFSINEETAHRYLAGLISALDQCF